MDHFGAGGDIAEPVLDLGARGGGVDIARQHEHRIVGPVMVAEPALDIRHRGGVEIAHRADGRVMIAMALGKEVLEDFVAQQAEGTVVALALLVLDDAALVIELLLRHRIEQMPHAIALEHQDAVERAGRHGLEVIGTIGAGGAVDVGAAHLLDVFEPVRRGVLGAVEHQVFEQVREAGLARGLVLGADIVPHRNPDQRRLAVFVDDHGQAVVEREFIERQIHFGDQLGQRSGFELLRLRCSDGCSTIRSGIGRSAV